MKRYKYSGWVLKRPNGLLEPGTFNETKDGCWMLSFPLIGDGLGTTSFQQKYWKRWNPSIRAAKKMGYEMVKVYLSRCAKEVK